MKYENLIDNIVSTIMMRLEDAICEAVVDRITNSIDEADIVEAVADNIADNLDIADRISDAIIDYIN